MTKADLNTLSCTSGNVALGTVPEAYYDLSFKVGEKWYKGYYEYLWRGSFRAYAKWTRHYLYQKFFEKSEVTEWYYI